MTSVSHRYCTFRRWSITVTNIGRRIHHCIRGAQRFTLCDLLSFVNFVGKFTANNSLIICYTISYSKMLHCEKNTEDNVNSIANWETYKYLTCKLYKKSSLTAHLIFINFTLQWRRDINFEQIGVDVAVDLTLKIKKISQRISTNTHVVPVIKKITKIKINNLYFASYIVHR